MLSILRGITYTQAYGCRFCLHVGSTAFYFGRRNGPGSQLEILTHHHWVRWSKGRELK